MAIVSEIRKAVCRVGIIVESKEIFTLGGRPYRLA